MIESSDCILNMLWVIDLPLIFRAEIFAESIFTILAINREKEVPRKYFQQNLMIFQFKETDFLKPSINRKMSRIGYFWYLK